MHVRYLDHCFEPGVDKPDIGEEVESGVAGNKAVLLYTVIWVVAWAVDSGL